MVINNTFWHYQVCFFLHFHEKKEWFLVIDEKVILCSGLNM